MKITALFLILLLVWTTFAEDLYVAQIALGADTGASAANAKSLAWANTSGNWGSGAGKISAGDNLILVGTITNTLNILGAGSSGNVITVKQDVGGSKFSAPYFSTGTPNNYDGGAIRNFGQSYVDLDGLWFEGVGNGDGLAYTNGWTAVNFTSVSRSTIRNCVFTNLYIRVAGTNRTGATAIQNTCKNGTAYSFFTVENCKVYHASTGIDTDYSGVTHDNTFRSNTIAYVNWGIRTGDRDSNSTNYNLAIYGNDISHFSNWDGTDAASQAILHHNGIYCWAESGGKLQTLSISRNIIGPDFTITSPNQATSGVFISGVGAVGPITIDNNLFLEETSAPSNGDIFLWAGYGVITHVYNNTVIGSGSGIGIGLNLQRGGTHNLKNNLITRKNAINITYSGTTTETLNIDYNLGYDLVSGQAYSKSTTGSSSFKNFAQWQALGYDAHGLSSNPSLDANYVPQTGSPAIGVGVDLSAYFTTDMNGTTRPALWAIGAFEPLSSPVVHSATPVKRTRGVRR